MTDPIWPIISNTEALAVNQAWSGFSGSVFLQANATITYDERYGATPVWSYWYKPVNSTATAVLMINGDTATDSYTLNFNTIPGVTCTTCKLRDIWNHADLGSFSGSWTTSIDSHDSAFLIISSA